MVERREFIKTISGLTATMMLPASGFGAAIADQSDRLGKIMKSRPLAGTDESLTMLCVGGYHFGHCSEQEAQAILETALENGIRFFDCAVQYQNGGSEERYGKLLTPKYRDVVYYMTKSKALNADDAKKELDDSLRRANTDYIDLWQIHSLDTVEDVEDRLENGVLDVFLQAKEDGKVRHIGFSGHRTPDAHLLMLEKTKDTKPFTTVQMPINVCDPNYSSFIVNVLPKLVENNISPLAMKTLSFGNFYSKNVIPEYFTVEQAMHFVWSLPVTSIVTGAETAEQLQQKIDALKTFDDMTEEIRTALIEKVKDISGTEMESYKA